MRLWVACALATCLVLPPGELLAQQRAPRARLEVPELDTRLPAPDWSDCEPVSEDHVCMDLEQVQHVLRVYTAYLQMRSRVRLQSVLLREYEEQYASMGENVQALMVQLDAAHLSMEKRQQAAAYTPPNAQYTTTELIVYCALAVVGGYLLSYAIHQ